MKVRFSEAKVCMLSGKTYLITSLSLSLLYDGFLGAFRHTSCGKFMHVRDPLPARSSCLINNALFEFHRDKTEVEIMWWAFGMSREQGPSIEHKPQSYSAFDVCSSCFKLTLSSREEQCRGINLDGRKWKVGKLGSEKLWLREHCELTYFHYLDAMRDNDG